MKYLIAGLGNIGPEYEQTRHNIGFLMADALARDLGCTFDIDKLASVATGSFRGRPVIIIKPTTYMNLSGKAVAYWMQKEKILPQNVLVLVDDIAIPFGAIRLKSRGSHGGHNGHKSIEECLGNNNYPRLRFGIGDDFHKGKQVDHVLGEWSAPEMTALPARIDLSVEAIKSFMFVGVEKTMGAFNNK
jgi:PTH1 family peptidyl-tRNA hydrolase